jgi:hypothetical protein
MRPTRYQRQARFTERLLSRSRIEPSSRSHALGSARLFGRSRSSGRPAARLSQRSDADTSWHPVAQRASPLFPRRSLEHGMGQYPLQLAVLVLQRPQPLGVGHVETTELGLPFIKRRRVKPETCRPSQSCAPLNSPVVYRMGISPLNGADFNYDSPRKIDPL